MEYGAVAFITWWLIFLLSLGGFYIAFTRGVDVGALLASMGLGEDWSSDAAPMAAAYAATQVLKPIRILIVLTLTPFVAKILSRVAPGWSGAQSTTTSEDDSSTEEHVST